MPLICGALCASAIVYDTGFLYNLPKPRKWASEGAGMARTYDGETGAPATAGSVGRGRWGISALLFFATTINYIDRQMISVLKPTLQGE